MRVMADTSFLYMCERINSIFTTNYLTCFQFHTSHVKWPDMQKIHVLETKKSFIMETKLLWLQVSNIYCYVISERNRQCSRNWIIWPPIIWTSDIIQTGLLSPNFCGNNIIAKISALISTNQLSEKKKDSENWGSMADEKWIETTGVYTHFFYIASQCFITIIVPDIL